VNMCEGVQTILGFNLINLRGCSINITDSKFHKDWLRHSKVNGGEERHNKDTRSQVGNFIRLLFFNFLK
jgi:hypothetical protein